MYFQISFVCLFIFYISEINFVLTKNNTIQPLNRRVKLTSSMPKFQDVGGILNQNVSSNNFTFSTNLKKKRKRRKQKRNKIKAIQDEEQLLIKNYNISLNSLPSSEPRKKTRKRRRKKKKQYQNNTLEVSTLKYSYNKHYSLQKTDLLKRLNNNVVTPFVSNSLYNTRIHSFAENNTKISNHSNSSFVLKKRNRCSVNNGDCSQICKQRGKAKCSCLKGYRLARNRKKCVDIDECRKRNGGCQEICRNTLGAYFCDCRPGFRLTDDLKTCHDVNECHLRNGHGPCQDTCFNTIGSYTCDCSHLNGSRLSVDKHSCEDIDECKESNPGCSHLCINTRSGAYCNCLEGMELMSDYKTCQDVDECEDTTIKSSCVRGCVNTVGSYYCEEDFQNDYNMKKIKVYSCPPLDVPQHGFITCLRNDTLPYDTFSKNGRKIIKNSPGTTCLLECPIGFKILGEGRFICGINGTWITKKKGVCIKSSYPKLTCPPDQLFFLKQNRLKALVNFPSPQTNIRWKIVTSYPTWAKDLKGELEEGRHSIQFSVTDPASKLSSTCSFLITVTK